MQATLTEAVYASGIIRSKHQYKVYPAVNGVIQEVRVSEGDIVKKGTILFVLRGESVKLNTETAELTKEYTRSNLNGDRLEEMKKQVEIAHNQMVLDSAIAARQYKLWQQDIGTRAEWEQKDLGGKNARENYQSAVLRYQNAKKELTYQADQAEKIWKLNRSQFQEYEVRSEQDGRVYAIYKKEGEWAGIQQELALLGSAEEYLLELQVDENDIVRIQPGQKVVLTLDSYKKQVFEARVSKINPAMNEKTRTFEVEAEWTQPPPRLYPNLTADANIILQVRENALLIPRSYLVQDSFVWVNDDEKRRVITGLKDYEQVEVLEGLKAGEVIQKDIP